MPGLALGTAFGIANVIVPKGGPKCIPALLDFSNAGEIEIDGSQVIDSGGIEYLQGLYIDNSLNTAPISFTMGTTGQVITCPANSQGYFSIMQPNTPKLIATMAQLNNRKVQVHFYNVPIQSAVWKTQ